MESKSGLKILTSSENLLGDKLLAPSGSKSDNSVLKNTKITNFFHKENTSTTDSKKNEIKSCENKRHGSDSDMCETKKIKRSNEVVVKNEINIAVKKISFQRCFICRQYLNSSDLLFYNGHPNGAVDEFIALTDPKLMLFTGEESEIDSHDERPHNKLTHFSVYDKEGHLCPIDAGLIESNVLLFFSGYLKPIYEDNPSPEGGIPTKDMGPINEWWVAGFDGGEGALFGFSTAFGEYYLMDPSEEYAPLMKTIREKIYLSKILIEFLLKNGWQNPSYEDLLNYITSAPLAALVDPTRDPVGRLEEEHLLRHAQFLCDQVASFDAAAEEDDLLITTSCMRSLVKLAGVTFGKRKEMRKQTGGAVKVKKKRGCVWSKATTTNLVREVFESFFPEQLDKAKDQLIRRKRCGVCATCQLPDCGKCSMCLDKAKFGGKGKSKQACVHRRCPNMAIQEADDSEAEDPEEDPPTNLRQPPTSSKRVLHPVEWQSAPIADHSGRTYYSETLVGETTIRAGDYVMLHSNRPELPLLVAKVAYMFEEPLGGKQFHAHLFCRGSETVLGEISDPHELFLVDDCEKCPLGAVVQKAEVEMRKVDGNWFQREGLELNLSVEDDDGRFFCQKRYDRRSARFEDLEEEEDTDKLGYKPCGVCRRKCEKKSFDKPKLEEDRVICWRGEKYGIGSGVYLVPGTFEFKTAPILQPTGKENEDPVDEEIFPEYYRKKSDYVNASGNEIAEPFCIGYIVDILTKSDENKIGNQDIEIKVQKLYRPENTHKGKTLAPQLDLNLIYWSEEQLVVNFSKVAGKCYLVYRDILDLSIQEWSNQGPNRFYFVQTYDVNSQQFLSVGESGNFVGRQRKDKGHGKGKGKSGPDVNSPTAWTELDRPLRTLDVFAGCGGLSEGLHQSGVAETKWAIEKEEPAAQAFRLNNPNTLVYTEDCNRLLSKVLSGNTHTETGQPLPSRGDVELLCGGPPCQGFSGMNRFNAGQYSLFKNSLIVSYLSFCDFYRPKYFILENVRNFVHFKKSIVLKLTLRCLLAMGYQCTFGVLQAGNYGIPQIRRRLIILAAAPGEVLPEFPEPTHVFSRKSTQMNIFVDNCRYTIGSKWLNVGAPYRTITVRDAMSDLPQVRNGGSQQEQPYDSEPLSHFQRLMRSSDDQASLRDHICKEMAPIVEARMTHIPTAPGSDWRDLPNIVVRLSDGTYTNKLRYAYRDKKNGPGTSGRHRGVCPCASGWSCDPSDRQYNTLIPWCLPHTANRHWHWVGLYGRLEWDGVFSTTVTNPEPMGKQGRVLHPEQNRVVSLRECARSQGFPDRYRFFGNVLDKHRQIGNAVPPPMGAAIGRQIAAAIKQKKSV